MPSVKLSPLFNDAQLDNNGLPLSGGFVYWYIAGTTTPVTVYTESSGSTVNTNPVILNTRGEPVQPIWLPTGQSYKAVLTDGNGGLIRTIDNISGVNDTTTPVISEWVLYAGSATYISGTSFSVTGDATATFDNGRRVKATVSGTDRYGTVNGAPVFALGVTTVTLTLDSGVLDSSLATAYYGFLDPAHPSFDTTGVNTNTKAGIQSQTWVAFTTSGSSGTYTLTPNPAITAYAVGQKFNVTFNAASNTTNTININGLGAKSLKMYNYAGSKIDAIFALNQVSDIIYDGTDFVLLNVPQSATTSPALTGIPTAPTPTTGDNDTSIATTAFVNNSCIGLGQTWQNVTRTSGTTYYNTTGKPIMLGIIETAAVQNIAYSVSINGVSVCSVTQNYTSSTDNASSHIVIPVGASYVLTLTAGTFTIVELR